MQTMPGSFPCAVHIHRAFLAWSALALAPAGAGAAGAPDPAFGDNGLVTVRAEWQDPAGDESIYATLRDAQGRYLLGGRAEVSAFSDTGLLVRRLPDGTPDPALGGVGHVHVEWDGYGVMVHALREQPADGRLLVGGRLAPSHAEQPPLFDAVVCRLLPDGGLDTGFGLGGCRTLTSIAGRQVVVAGYASSGLAGLELLPDGSILVLGTARKDADDPRSFALVRLDASGDVDFGFGDSDCPDPAPRCGSVFSPAGLADAMGVPLMMALYPTGDRVAVAGAVDVFDRAAILRFGTDGVLEQGASLVEFEDLTGVSDDVRPADLLVEGDGSIVLLAAARSTNPVPVPAIAKLLPDGGYDPGFGASGRAVYSDDSWEHHDPTALLRQNDGRFVIGLSAGLPSCKALRIAANGDLDPTFGDGGLIDVPAGLLGQTGCYIDEVLISDQHLVFAGHANHISAEGGRNPFLYRVDRDGLFADGFDATP